jgi:hypothetical protein
VKNETQSAGHLLSSPVGDAANADQTPHRAQLREEVARAMYLAHQKRNKGWLLLGLAERLRWLASADAAIALIVERCAQVAQEEAGAYTEDGEGDYWVALRIRDRLMSLAPQPEARP